MKSKYDIFHIYHGTQGAAGLYTDEIYQSLKENYNQNVFVSYYYPCSYGDKVFYKKSTIGEGIRHDFLRKIIKYFELSIGLMKVLLQVIKYKPKLINYSLISLYGPERLFLRIVNLLTDTKLIITCHDVIPFTSQFGRFDFEMKKRKRYFDMADFLLVHNKNSSDELNKIYNIKIDKILYHPFPIMDLKKMDFKYKNEKLFDFVFIGVLRQAKGIHILLEAWEKFNVEFPHARLLVAGKLAGEYIDVQKYLSKNVIFNFKYLNDYEYCSNIYSANCVVLPYLRGTNSGIPSSVLSLGTDIIASDIPMFKNNDIIPEESFFKSEDSQSLFAVLKNKYCSNNIVNKTNYIKYKNDFNYQVLSVYNTLLNHHKS